MKTQMTRLMLAAVVAVIAHGAWALNFEGDYYLIGTAQDLKDFAVLVNSGNTTANGKLIAPIDLAGSETNQWTPIGAGTTYNGTFDGQGFTVSNLYYHQVVASPGLFGHAGGSARIKNVRVVVDIDNTGNGATAAGGGTEAGGILGTGSEGTVIINCSVSGSVLSFSNVGGIVGSGTVTIVNCCNEATVKFYSGNGQTGGGIHGYGGTPTIINCYNVGKIINTGSETSHIGNIATEVSSATNCYSLENSCQNGAEAAPSNGTKITGTTKTLAEIKSTSFVSTLNNNVASLRTAYPDIEDWMLHPATSLPVHKNTVKYTITYNLDGGSASNVAYYDVTTATFTLNSPTKAGYLFTGWTGSNGSTPQTVVTVAQGSTGNKAYTANWISWDEVNAYVGKVIGADGKMYKTVAAAQNAGTTASGVIAYWGWAGSVEAGTTYRGMAIALEDAVLTWGSHPNHTEYCTSASHQCSSATPYCSTVSVALNAKNGIAATQSALANNGEGHWHNAAGNGDGVALPSGASGWAIPSIGQWNLMAQGLTGNSSNLSDTDNPDYHYNNLSTKINAAGGTHLEWLFYWSSTEQDASNAWCLSIGGLDYGRNGSRAFTIAKNHNDEYMHVRMFFAFEDATDAVYTISYNAHGGSGAPSAQTKDGGIDLTLSSTAPTRAGYTFAGWNTAADGSGTSYASGATFTGNVDTTLYAQWGGYGAWAEENSVTGAWDEEDASGVPNAFRYVFDQPEGEFDAVSGVDVVGSSVTMITPAVVNTEGFTISYALDKVSKAGEVIEEGTPSASAEGLAINYASIVSNAYFKVAVVLESSGGTESRTKMDSEATIGVLAITNAPATAIIGVPWVALSGGGAISVSNLVYTANLTAGDKLQAFDDNGSLQAWTLNGGVWTADYIAGDNEQELSDDADTVKLARGKGVWLTRQDPTAPIYLVGQVCTNKVETALEKPTEPGAKVWNLVASPKVEPVDVAQLLDGRQATDKVMVPTKGAPKNFIYMGGKWGYIDYETDENGLVHAKFVTDDTTVPAGTGFWYLNGDMSNEKIDW